MIKYIGICENCEKYCCQSKASLSNHNQGAHKIITKKQMLRKPQIKNLHEAQQIYDEYLTKINDFIEQSIKYLQRLREAYLEKNWQALILQNISKQKINQKEYIGRLIREVTDDNYEKIKCKDIHFLLSSLSQRQYSQTLQKIFDKNLQQLRLKAIEKLQEDIPKPKHHKNQISIINPINQKSKFINRNSFYSLLNNVKVNENQNQNSDFSLDSSDDESQLVLVRQSDNLSKITTKETVPNTSKSIQYQNFYKRDNLNSTEQSKTQIKSIQKFDMPLKQQFKSKHIHQEQIRPKKLQYLNNQHLNKKQEFDSPQQQINQDLALWSNPNFEQDQQQKRKDQKLSYIDPNHYDTKFVKAKKLDSKQYQEHKIPFNIQLKVVKILAYREIVLKGQVNDYKTILKVKFIGGDQTGLVVCFCNSSSKIKNGSSVTLKKCSIELFKDKSYEIIANKILISNYNIQKIQYQKCLSDICPNLNYKYTGNSSWPSIYGIISMQQWQDSKNIYVKNLNFIVKIDYVFYDQNEKQFSGECYDGTGKIYFTYKKNSKQIQISQTKTYIFKKMTAFRQKVGKSVNLYISNKLEQNKSKPKQVDVCYDDPSVKNVSLIFQQNDT